MQNVLKVGFVFCLTVFGAHISTQRVAEASPKTAKSTERLSDLPAKVTFSNPDGLRIVIEITKSEKGKYLVTYERIEKGRPVKKSKLFGPEIANKLISELKVSPPVLDNTRSDQGCAQWETWTVDLPKTHLQFCKTEAMMAKLDRFQGSVSLVLR